MTHANDEYDWALRNLPGVAEVERLLALAENHPNPLWAPEQDQAQRLVNEISLRAFGITQADTYVNPQRRRSLEAQHNEVVWERSFEDEDGEQLHLSVVFCDPNDAEGIPLRSVPYFARQIICSTLGLKGHKPDLEFEKRSLARDAEDWAAKMKRDALNWRPSRKR